MSLLLTGNPASRGIVIARARILHGAPLEVPEAVLPAGQVESEVQRLRKALAAARRQLTGVRGRIPADAPPDIGHLVEIHISILRDRTFTRELTRLIRERQCNAEWALKLHRDKLLSAFASVEDPYLRGRRDDITQVVERVLSHLMQKSPTPARRENRRGRLVYVTGDPAPADLILMREQGLVALVCESGSPLSHTSILARSLGVTAITGVSDACRLLRDDETLIVDGENGGVLAQSDARALRHYRNRQRSLRARAATLRTLRDKPARTRDRQAVRLLANIELPADLRAMQREGAAGIGLYRTESLYRNRPRLPDEEELLAAYARILRAAGGLPVTIRTLDLAPRELPAGTAPDAAANPALGLRGIRLGLVEPALLLPQLRALLRAARLGSLRIMLPMVTHAEDVVQTRQLLETARRQLRRARLAHAQAIPLGAMIEVPAAALTADAIAREADFLSLGTNDLAQYCLAVDRDERAVAHWHDPVHPALLRMIADTLQAGARRNKPVSLCGEMAGDARFTRLLLGLGLREFSMRPASLQEVKAAVRLSDTSRLAGLARRLLRSRDPRQQRRLLEEIARD